MKLRFSDVYIYRMKTTTGLARAVGCPDVYIYRMKKKTGLGLGGGVWLFKLLFRGNKETLKVWGLKSKKQETDA